MDILLSHGYYLALDPAEAKIQRPYPPLGLLHLSAHLKEVGKTVEVFDTTFSTPDDFEQRVRDARPPIVGLYVNMMTRSHVLKAIKLCKSLGSTVVLGGPEPANFMNEYLAAGADFIVRGEGEITLAELLDATRLDGIAGIAYSRNGEVVATEARKPVSNLDDLPWPDRKAIDLNQYLDHWERHHGVRSVSLITARGCPYTCRWCSHSVYGYSYRSRSPDNVADEVEWIQREYAPNQLWYADDVFTINKKWLVRYANALEARNLSFPFETISREDRLDEEVIALLAKMRCRKLWVGAESGSQRILDKMDRKTNAVRMREMMHLLRQHRIENGTFLMFGYDGERWEDIDATAAHVLATMPDEVLTTVSYPIKGTPYYEDVHHKVIATTAWHESSDRDLKLSGQRSRVFYRFTTQWINARLRYARETGLASRRRWLRRLRALLAGMLARIGMRLTWNLRS